MADHTLNVRIDKELMKGLSSIAEKSSTTVSTLVREQLEEFAAIQKKELLKIEIPSGNALFNDKDIETAGKDILEELSTPDFSYIYGMEYSFTRNDMRSAEYLLQKIAMELYEQGLTRQIEKSSKDNKEIIDPIDSESIVTLIPINPRLILPKTMEIASKILLEISMRNEHPENRSLNFIFRKISMQLLEISFLSEKSNAKATSKTNKE